MESVMIRSLIALTLLAFSAWPAYSMRPCNLGFYNDGEECTIGGRVICKFSNTAPVADRAARWACRTRDGKRLYWQKRKGQWHLVRRRR